MTIENALNILQAAVDRCRAEDIRSPEVESALTIIERRSAMMWLVQQFRFALNSGTRQHWKESLWQILTTSLNGIRLNLSASQS